MRISKRLSIAIVGWMAMAGSVSMVSAAEKDVIDVFMRAKLQHSQKVLEGLTTEDFSVVAKHSQAMALLSQDQQWQVLQTPEYLQRSVEFRRAIEALTEAAKKENLDGATLAYVDVTMKCIECHKYLRRVRQARNLSPAKPESIRR